MFQVKSSDKLKKVVPGVDITIWTSHLTIEENIDNLNNEDYTIQIWADGKVRTDLTYLNGII
jgi:hypothetical protein